jgi:hypothetical protein
MWPIYLELGSAMHAICYSLETVHSFHPVDMSNNFIIIPHPVKTILLISSDISFRSDLNLNLTHHQLLKSQQQKHQQLLLAHNI